MRLTPETGRTAPTQLHAPRRAPATRHIQRRPAHPGQGRLRQTPHQRRHRVQLPQHAGQRREYPSPAPSAESVPSRSHRQPHQKPVNRQEVIAPSRRQAYCSKHPTGIGSQSRPRHSQHRPHMPQSPPKHVQRQTNTPRQKHECPNHNAGARLPQMPLPPLRLPPRRGMHTNRTHLGGLRHRPYQRHSALAVHRMRRHEVPACRSRPSLTEPHNGRQQR